MVPWSKLPKDVQKAILALIVLSAGSSVASCRPPVVFDPLPPPSSAPTRTATRSVVPTPTLPHVPSIPDPSPPPPVTLDPQVVRRFKVRNIQITSYAYAVIGAGNIYGTVYDKQGKPLAGLKVVLRSAGTEIASGITGRGGMFSLRFPTVGTFELVLGDDTSSALSHQLKQYDVANVQWDEIPLAPQTPLPLAEIRTVDILWGDGLTFQVETPWPGARYRWSVSGGTLTGEKEEVAWEPPAEPGCYLLQLVADWGYEGLAVDSLVLTVNRDGSIFIS